MRKLLFSQVVIYTLGIVLIGLVALYSASYDNVRVSNAIFFDQFYGALLGFAIMYILSRIDLHHFYDGAYVFYIINILMLVWVLLSGKDAMGARRWMSLGPLSFQPSELTKLSLILCLSRYWSHRRPKLSFNFFSRAQVFGQDFLFPLGLTLLPMAFIFKQPDLGTSLLMMGIFLVMAFMADVDKRYVFGFVLLGVAVTPFAWHFLRDYQKDRLLVFLNPNIDPLGAGYTIIQSKIAIGSGQMFGKGWLAGTQNHLNFLPERHTDFIFSVIGEEWGFMGGMLLIVFYGLLILTCFKIAEHVKDRFGHLVAVGIISIVALQVFINIGMVMGMMPIVGLTLPMVSYGRTSFMIFMIMMGFLLNLSRKRLVF